MALERWANRKLSRRGVHASTGCNHVEGNRRASRNGIMSDLPPEIPNVTIRSFCPSLCESVPWVGKGRTWHTGSAEASASWAQRRRVLQHADDMGGPGSYLAHRQCRGLGQLGAAVARPAACG
jgi:hypothetical protein